jgi:predicted phage terminase large subunit-like protein
VSDALNSTLSTIASVKRLVKVRDERNRQRKGVAGANPLAMLGVMDLIPQVVKKYRSPTHLQPMVDVLEEAWVRPVRVTIHAPPQHQKTTTLSMWIVATLLRAPGTRIGYMTYNQSLALDKGSSIRKLAKIAGVLLSDDTDAKGEWQTTAGGGLVAVGMEQGLTGRAVDILVVDDPYKDRKHARSKAWQKVVMETWSDVIETRSRANTSIIVQHTRWMPNDLIGMLKSGKLGSTTSKDYQFRHINLAAEDEHGEPLNPLDWPKERLAGMKGDLVTWYSLFMGEPRPEGSSVFSDMLMTYQSSDLPIYLQKSIGLDFAYTKTQTADSSVAICVGRAGNGSAALYYVLDMLIMQTTAPEFAARFKLFKQAHPLTRCRAYVSGVERGATAYLTQPPPMGAGIEVDVVTATADKLVRALPTSGLWNRGQILVPEDAPWANEFVETLTNFTGAGGQESDDIVDALAAAVDLLLMGQDDQHVVHSANPRTAASYTADYAPGFRRGKSIWGK